MYNCTGEIYSIRLGCIVDAGDPHHHRGTSTSGRRRRRRSADDWEPAPSSIRPLTLFLCRLLRDIRADSRAKSNSARQRERGEESAIKTPDFFFLFSAALFPLGRPTRLDTRYKERKERKKGIKKNKRWGRPRREAALGRRMSITTPLAPFA